MGIDVFCLFGCAEFKFINSFALSPLVFWFLNSLILV